MAKRTLLERLAFPSTLRRAYIEVMSGANPDSAGSDGITIDQFRRSSNSRLGQLRADIQSGKYQSSLGRAVPIPKNKRIGPVSGNVRPITIFNVNDRIVHRGISNLIWPHVRGRVHSDVSFGGIREFALPNGRNRKTTDVKKNVRAAARRILELRRDGHAFTFESDIKSFFPSIDKERLIRMLAAMLPDDSLLGILHAAIQTNVVNQEEIDARGLSEYWDPRAGVPQGGVLSPLLANLYLAPFDEEMTEQGFALIRYVDDFVVMCETPDEALRAYSTSKSLLEQMGLEIHPRDEKNNKGQIKTRIVSEYGPFDFLGLRINKRTIQPSQRKIDDLKDRISCVTHGHFGGQTLVDVVNRLNRMLRGWTAAYAFCDVPHDLLTEIDHAAGSGLASWLEYHKLIRDRRALSREKRVRIGLWEAGTAKIDPLSTHVFADHGARVEDRLPGEPKGRLETVPRANLARA